jgi:hypothetical protein
MMLPNANALFTPWVSNDDEMHIRFRRSKAIAIATSLLLHLLFVFIWYQNQQNKPLTVSQAAHRPVNIFYIPTESPPAIQAAAPKSPRAPKPRPAQRRSTAVAVPNTALPPVVEMPPPVAQAAPPAPTPIAEAPPEPKPEPAIDMMAMLKAQRAAQGRDSAGPPGGREPSASDVATANINRNLATLATKPDGTNGVFQILSKGTRVGQFSFNGWKTDKNNSWREVIDVDAGLLGDVELAIVRRMIELIRSHYQGDFSWDSHKLGRVVTLSARLEDTAGLEAFMLREFFSERR